MTKRRAYGILTLHPAACPRGLQYFRWEMRHMTRIKTLKTRDLCASAKNGGCGECQTSCQSACKTSCGVANQKCENEKK